MFSGSRSSIFRRHLQDLSGPGRSCQQGHQRDARRAARCSRPCFAQSSDDPFQLQVIYGDKAQYCRQCTPRAFSNLAILVGHQCGMPCGSNCCGLHRESLGQFVAMTTPIPPMLTASSSSCRRKGWLQNTSGRTILVYERCVIGFHRGEE